MEGFPLNIFAFLRIFFDLPLSGYYVQFLALSQGVFVAR